MASQVDAVRVEQVVKTVQIVLYGLTIALGSVGNALVVWVIGARLKPTATNVCLLNLAVADLVFSISRVLSVSYLSLDHWLFGLALCQFNGLLKYANMFCSVFLLVVISLDRALCVQRPIQAKSLRTVGRARAINVAVWVAAVVLSLPYSVSRTVVVKVCLVFYCLFLFSFYLTCRNICCVSVCLVCTMCIMCRGSHTMSCTLGDATSDTPSLAAKKHL